MARMINKNQSVIDEFSAFDISNTNKMPGLSLPDDFTVTVFHNKILRTDIAVTIGEYGTTGSYWVEWIPDQIGFWEIEVKVLATSQYWYETFDCIYNRDPGDESNKVYDIRGSVVWNSLRDEIVAMAWLSKNGQLVSTSGQCEWSFYDSDDNLLFTLQQNTSFPTGVYRAKHGNPGFLLEENYYYTCRIHNGIDWKKSALGVITIM